MRRKVGVGVLFGALALHGEMPLAAAEEREAKLTVLVHDYAGVDSTTLLAAQTEAQAIFQRAGVAIIWQRCHPQVDAQENQCAEFGPSALALRLVPRLLLGSGVRADTLGYAIGYIATVSLEVVENIAQSGLAPKSQVLALAIVHELGHLLLGTGHSTSGIMHARWGLGDWSLAGQDGLVFLPRQAAQLRKELRNRNNTSLVARNVQKSQGNSQRPER